MIKSYIENSKTFWLVYVNIRSQKSRLQKRIKNIESEAEAKKLEKKLLRECERELLAKAALGETWSNVVDEFEKHINSSDLHLHTRLDYVAAIRKHTDAWSMREAAGLTRVDARELFQSLTVKSLSIGHQKKIKIVINRIFDFGIEHGLIKGIQISPAQGIEFSKEEEKKPEILTILEIKSLLQSAKALNHPWYPVWALALLTGMRNGELYALEWSDIDWENKLINLTKSYNTRTRSVKCTKAGYWRAIPISTELEMLLKELKLSAGVRKSVLPKLPHWEKGGQAKVLRSFCQGINLPSIKFHTLRACFATQLIRQGIPPIQIQKICGWKDLETMQRYVRLAGIEVTGVTEHLKILPEEKVMAAVVNLFQPTS